MARNCRILQEVVIFFVRHLQRLQLVGSESLYNDERHVANLKSLDEAGRIELAGVFKGYPGVAGMYILRAESYEEARSACA